MALTDTEVKILTLIEQRFWETGFLVSNEKVAETLAIDEKHVKKAWTKEDFRAALMARGIDLEPEKTTEVLTPQQVLVVNMLMNTHDTQSVREKLQLAGVKSQTYHAWLRQPAFQSYVKKRAEAVFGAAESTAFLSHVKAMEDGDMNAVKLFYEMKGIYNPKVTHEFNVQSMLIRIVEVVARHVQDQDTMLAIASELEALVAPTNQMELTSGI